MAATITFCVRDEDREQFLANISSVSLESRARNHTIKSTRMFNSLRNLRVLFGSAVEFLSKTSSPHRRRVRKGGAESFSDRLRLVGANLQSEEGEG